jgi:hypothetical protein
VAALALLDIHSTGSLMYAMEHLVLQAGRGLHAAGDPGREDRNLDPLSADRGGCKSILYLAGILLANPVLIDLGYYAAGVLRTVTSVLLAVRYRRDP